MGRFKDIQIDEMDQEIFGLADMQSDEELDDYFRGLRSHLLEDLDARVKELESVLVEIEKRLPINSRITLDPEFIVVQRTILAIKQIMPGLEG